MKQELQEKRLDYFYRTRGYFRVAAHTTYGTWKYFNYYSDDAYDMLKMDALTDRDVLDDEIVIETDMNMRKMNKSVSEWQEKRLLSKNFSYEKWHSGNKSYHIHIFFSELLLIENDYNRKLLKQLFIKWLYKLLEDSSDEVLKIRRKNMASHKVDLNLCGKHLIRLEYSQHTSTGSRKKLLTENINDVNNKIPYIVWKNFALCNTYKYYNNSNNFIKVSNMNCINYFLNNSTDDCRKRIAFILVNNLKSLYTEQLLFQILDSWNININEGYLSKHYISYLINYHYNTPPSPKCRYIQDILFELGLDVCEDCMYGDSNG